MSKTMTLVRDIEVFEVQTDTVAISKATGKAISPFECISHGIAEVERVTGQRYQTDNGKIVCLGMSKKVRDILGLPLEIFQIQTKQINDLQEAESRLATKLRKQCDANQKLSETIEKIKKLGFIDRLKVLFGANPVGLANRI